MSLGHQPLRLDDSGIGSVLATLFMGAAIRRIQAGRLTIVTPSGQRVERLGTRLGPEGVLVLANWRAVRRTISRGAIGFAEGYLAEDWTSPDLPSLLELLEHNSSALPAASGLWISRALGRIWHRMNANTRAGSRKNIGFHYDMGNAFFERWLDRGMQYSSAIFSGPSDLESAQEHKLDRIAHLLALEGRERVLEIGCGWGALAERLARSHDCQVTGLTLSHQQATYARERLAAAGLGSRAHVRLQDYRDCEGRFDRVVSIEMIEAVGAQYWSAYFAAIRERLARGGIAVIQAITIQEAHFDDYLRNPDFIQRYVFPGGMLPTRAILRREIAAAGLSLVDTQTFGSSYAATLAEWRRRFHAAWSGIEPLGFDGRFRRLWTYYLAYCEAGFRAGTIDVGLYVIKG